jgi:hypothetical protein
MPPASDARALTSRVLLLFITPSLKIDPAMIKLFQEVC